MCDDIPCIEAWISKCQQVEIKQGDFIFRNQHLLVMEVPVTNDGINLGEILEPVNHFNDQRFYPFRGGSEDSVKHLITLIKDIDFIIGCMGRENF